MAERISASFKIEDNLLSVNAELLQEAVRKQTLISTIEIPEKTLEEYSKIKKRK